MADRDCRDARLYYGRGGGTQVLHQPGPDERYFARYARNEVHEPRQCVFVGTTNRERYLRDETGGRRFWPVKVVNPINVVALAADRDQLFAEAVVKFLADEPWWPHKDFEREHIKPQQDDRYEDDAAEKAVVEFLDSRVTGDMNRIYLLDLAAALGIERGRFGTSEQRRIISILTRRGWVRGKKDSKGLIPYVLNR